MKTKLSEEKIKITEAIIKEFLDKQISILPMHDLLVNTLMNNLQKLNYHEAGTELEKIGFSEFCGNQHNEEWRLTDKVKKFISDYITKQGYSERSNTTKESEIQIENTRDILKGKYLCG
jgi:hypothetical protein